MHCLSPEIAYLKPQQYEIHFEEIAVSGNVLQS